MRDDPQYIFTNMPDSEAEDDNATEVELSADECDSDEEIEEVMGNTVLVQPRCEVEGEEDIESIEWNWYFSSNWAGAFRASIASYAPSTLQLSLDQSTGIPTCGRSRSVRTTHLSHQPRRPPHYCSS